MSFTIKPATRQGVRVGATFGRLVIRQFDRTEKSHRYWLCDCQCGKRLSKREDLFFRVTYPSCGCHFSEVTSKRMLKHGHSRVGRHSRTYTAWLSMKSRCQNPKGKAIKTYGERGIKFCDRWACFENFFADMGECPPGHELDRVDNDGHYCKDNCRWATHAEQQRNKTNTIRITHNGRTQCARQWALELGIHPATLQYRISTGWPLEKALVPPPQRKAAA